MSDINDKESYIKRMIEDCPVPIKQHPRILKVMYGKRAHIHNCDLIASNIQMYLYKQSADLIIKQSEDVVKPFKPLFRVLTGVKD